MARRDVLMDEIGDRLGLPRVAKGVGSSVHNDFITPLVRAVGLDPAMYTNKYRRIEAVLNRLGATYNPNADTSEGTPSQGGGTLTNAGLEKIVSALLRIPDLTVDDVAVQLESGGLFDPDSLADARERMLRAVVVRRGQAAFRSALLVAYEGRCAVTAFDAEAALEAAHVVPYRGDHTNDVNNGLLLRADIHTLFDLGKLGLDPDDGHMVVVADELRGTRYERYDANRAFVPIGLAEPNPGLLRWHLHRWGLRQ